MLLERYGLIHCTAEQANALRGIIRGKKETPYGVEAVVLREQVPTGLAVSSIGIEELFVYLTKGGEGA